jgi:hypothetical protein
VAYQALSCYYRFTARLDPDTSIIIPAQVPMIALAVGEMYLLAWTPYPLLGPLGVLCAALHLGIAEGIRSSQERTSLLAPPVTAAPSVIGRCRECSAPILETMDECPCCAARRPLEEPDTTCSLPLPAEGTGREKEQLPRPACAQAPAAKQNGCSAEEEQPLSGLA